MRMMSGYSVVKHSSLNDVPWCMSLGETCGTDTTVLPSSVETNNYIEAL